MTKWWSVGKTKLAGVDIDIALFDMAGNLYEAVLFVEVLSVYSSLACQQRTTLHVTYGKRHSWNERKEQVCTQRLDL